MQRKLLGIINVDSDAIGQLLIIFCIRKILEKKWEHNEAVHQLFIDFNCTIKIVLNVFKRGEKHL